MADKKELSPFLSPVQRAAALKSYPPVPAHCVVIGGTGFTGQRVVEMLVERGAKKVVSMDIVPPSKLKHIWTHPAIEYQIGDVTNIAEVEKAVAGADCVWHLAAAVGPFHPHKIYEKVNYQGTVNVINACKKHKVPKLVYSSSPSTRFQGSLWKRPEVDGLTEDEMPKLPLKSYMQPYAGTKAMGEMAVTAACCDELLTVSVAPHQLYGPRDNLFLPNVMEAAGSGKLRIFASGLNRICFTHIDNYAHGLIISERQLYKGSPILGKFYITTDGDTHPCANDPKKPGAYCIFWKEIDRAAVGLGFKSLYKKFKLPFWLLYSLALVCEVAGWVMGTVFKLNVFNVFVLTMNRWFDIKAAEKDLKYEPIIPFNAGWEDTIAWFRANWLPQWEASADRKSLFGIARQSQAKIDIQADSTLGGKKPQ